jgi:hypothetical protein
VVFAALLPAACGGGDGGDDKAGPPPPPSPQATAVYERAYTECASTSLDKLAGKYHVSATRAAVVQAVGAGWADLLGGGQEAAQAGASGCGDGIDSRVSGSSS